VLEEFGMPALRTLLRPEDGRTPAFTSLRHFWVQRQDGPWVIHFGEDLSVEWGKENVSPLFHRHFYICIPSYMWYCRSCWKRVALCSLKKGREGKAKASAVAKAMADKEV